MLEERNSREEFFDFFKEFRFSIFFKMNISKLIKRELLFFSNKLENFIEKVVLEIIESLI